MTDDDLISKIYDIISNNIEIKDTPYSDYCFECRNGPKEINYKSIEKAANKIIQLINKNKNETL